MKAVNSQDSSKERVTLLPKNTLWQDFQKEQENWRITFATSIKCAGISKVNNQKLAQVSG